MRPGCHFTKMSGLPLLLTIITFALTASHVLARTSNEDGAQAQSAGSRLLNFMQFKIMFHKSYSSITEELRRQALFLGNLMQEFTTRLKFAHKWSSSYRSVNQMSDWTDEEFKSTLLTPTRYYEALGKHEVDHDDDEEEDPDEANFKQVVEHIVEQQVAASGVDLKRRKKRSIESVLETLERFDDKVYTTTNLAVQRALRTYYKVKWAPHDPSKPDEIFTDHRRCLGKVKSQQRCPCCFVFATLGLYEWAYCKSKSNDADEENKVSRIEFSAQYVLDCGAQVGVQGWDSGTESQVAKFVKKFGFELGSRYKFTNFESECAYNTRDEHERKTTEGGLLRLDKPKLTRITLDKFERQLEVSPLTIVIYTPNEFFQYGGGVDDGHGCAESGRALHAVLLVGSGRQDGHEYWLIRNSHGDTWGERGYYKVRKDSNCLADFGSGYTLKALKVGGGGSGGGEKEPKQLGAYEFILNPDYDWRLLARRYKKYVRGPPELPEPVLADADL